MKRQSWKWMLVLHGALLLYSCSGLFSKTAAQQPFLSLKFCLCYGGMLAIMLIYAFLWQQIIKHVPLTTAFANKAVTVVWGMVLGAIAFREQHSPRQFIAALIIIAGVVLFVLSDGEKQDE